MKTTIAILSIMTCVTASAQDYFRSDVGAVFAHGIDAVTSVLYRPCSIDEALAEGGENLRMAARNVASMVAVGLGLNGRAR